MELSFEYIDQVSAGEDPNFIQFPDTSAQLFNISSGEIFGEPINKADGYYDALTFENPNNVSPDVGISNFTLETLSGFGAVGSYKAGDKHILLIYEFAVSMDPYLVGGSIKKSIDNPVAQFDVEFSNPVDIASEEGAQVAVSEYEALVAPGAKLTFNFAAGDSDIYQLGTFYVDRSNFTLLGETATADGRNYIGKVLKDQTLDENNVISYGNFGVRIKELLELAKVTSDYYLVENTALNNGFDFDPNTTFLSAIQEMLKITIDWDIKELVDGTIVIGSPAFAGFENKSVYSFERNKDIFSRDITRDDQSSYRRVCVHDSEWTVKVYEEVSSYTGWNLQANKTLYAEVPKGTSQADAAAYALELASRLENVGKVETFLGPFRPHLVCGDEAIIIDEKGNHSLGLITQIEHQFGKGGFFTQFYVDSGGKIGKGRFSDYIAMLGRIGSAGNVSYEEPI